MQAADPEKRPGSREGRVMLGILSIICIVSGAAVTYRSGRDPAHARCMEIVAGLLLIGGVAMLGVELGPIVEAVNF
jgi:hypothetical protein